MNRSILKSILLAIVSGLFITPIYSQEQEVGHEKMYQQYTQLLSPEKVYLHTDKDVYFATDTIWFSGYVENTSYTSEFDESNYIYVELISNQLYRNGTSFINYSEYQNDVVVRKKIRRIGNSFQGHIVVPEMNSTGRAILRAYTYWMLNRPVEYMFYKELELTNPMKDKLVMAMAEKKIKKKEAYLRIGEKSPIEKSKAAKQDSIERYDVQFLPESGNYIIGERTVVYVKSVGTKGMGASVYGEIYDEEDNIVAHYITDSLGFGRVEIEELPGDKLTASVKSGNGYEGKRVKLPKAKTDGVTIQGRFSVSGIEDYSQSDKVQITVNTTGTLLSQGLKVYLHNGSEIYYSKDINNTEETLTVQLRSLTAGIHSVSVIDSEGNVYAERPLLVLPTEKEVLTLSTDSTEYGKRDVVDLSVKVPASLLDSISNFSLSVTDMGLTEDKEKTTIQSYMLLKSELKGYIEDIEWYFNSTIPLSERILRGDLLLQTQGWRYYEIDKIVQGKSEQPYFGREYRQTLFGKVVNPIGLTKRATVSFLAPSINFRAMGQIDSGYFVLRDVDFPENTRFIVSSIGKNGKSTSHMPILQNDYFAPVHDYPVRGEKVEYTDSYKKAVESIYYGKDDGDYAMAFELNPIVVTTQLITPKNSPSPIPNYPIRREWYRDSIDIKPYVKYHDLLSYITSTFFGIVNSPVLGLLLSRSPSASSGMAPGGRYTCLEYYVNGMSIDKEDFYNNYLFNIEMKDIESIIYVSGLSAKPFQPAQTMTQLHPSSILMIRTKPHVRTDLVPYNVSSAYPIGWQKPVKFYSPKYEATKRKKKDTDNRITVYWNPSLKFDNDGKATVSFYTTDSHSKYRVEVEGRSGARQYHHSELVIERKMESLDN